MLFGKLSGLDTICQKIDNSTDDMPALGDDYKGALARTNPVPKHVPLPAPEEKAIGWERRSSPSPWKNE